MFAKLGNDDDDDVPSNDDSDVPGNQHENVEKIIR